MDNDGVSSGNGPYIHVQLKGGREALMPLVEAAYQLSDTEMGTLVEEFMDLVDGEIESWALIDNMTGKALELKICMDNWPELGDAWKFMVIPYPGFSDS